MARADAAHRGQGVPGGYAAVHDPGALRAAAALLNALEQAAEGCAVSVAAAHDLVARREALGGGGQRDDDRAARAALVAAVAELAQVLRPTVLVGLEVGAGQVVRQHVELRAEEPTPAAQEELEKCVLVLHELVQVAVQRVLLGQTEVRFQQVGQGAAA